MLDCIHKKGSSLKNKRNEKANKDKTVINIDEGLDGEWIRILRISKEENLSIDEAKKVFSERYKERCGCDYPLSLFSSGRISPKSCKKEED